MGMFVGEGGGDERSTIYLFKIGEGRKGGEEGGEGKMPQPTRFHLTCIGEGRG